MRELIKEIWSTSKRNKLRTSLTGFAVAWGIFMLIFLLGAGNGLINAQLQQSTRFLANSMRVFPGETSKAYKGLKEGRSITLNDKDILISNKTYGQYVDDVGGRLEQYNVNINYGDNYVASQSLVGKLAPEIIEKAEREGRKFFDGNPQDNYPDQLEKYRKMMLEKQWDKGQDDEELFEYAMHPAQYEAYKSGKAKEDFLADVKKRREEKANATTPVEAENKTKVLTVDVNGQPYRVTVAYGAVDPATLTAASGAVPAQTAPAPVGEGKDVLSPLEGKFFLVKNAQETPKKVGDKVAKGEVICYVEAMKTYNAIRAEYDGTITAICVNSGDSVSEDDVLMKIL